MTEDGAARGFEGWLDQAGRQAAARRRARRAFDFTSPEAFAASQAALRAELRAVLRLDQAPPPAARPPRLGPAAAGSSWRTLTIEPWVGARFEALTLLPQGAPAVLLCGGLDDTPELALRPGGSLAELARRLAAAGLGLIVPKLPAGWRARLRLARKARLLGFEWLGLEVLALSRLLDAAEGLAAPATWGLAGFSRGGQAALLLAALDPRPAATAVAAWFGDRDARLLDGGDARLAAFIDSPEDEQFVPDWLPRFSDLELAALVAPRALWLGSGLDDPIVAFEQAETAFETVAATYERLGWPERAELDLFPGGHELPAAAVAEFLLGSLGRRSESLDFDLSIPAPDRRPRPKPRLSRGAQGRRRRARGW
jgi:dienelactone hydrolase